MNYCEENNKFYLWLNGQYLDYDWEEVVKPFEEYMLENIRVGDYIKVEDDSHKYFYYEHYKVVNIAYMTQEDLEAIYKKEQYEYGFTKEEAQKSVELYKGTIKSITLVNNNRTLIIDSYEDDFSDYMLEGPWQPRKDELVWLLSEHAYPVLRPYNEELNEDIKEILSRGHNVELQPFNGYPPIRCTDET